MKALNTYITEKFIDIDNYKVRNKKYELTNNTESFNGSKLHQIRALKTFETIDGKTVKKGDLGGWIQSEANLSQKGNCWTADNAIVYGHAKVYDDALIASNAIVCGDTQVYEDAIVCGDTQVYGQARVYGGAVVHVRAKIYGEAHVYGNAQVYGDAQVCGNAKVYDYVRVCGKAKVDYEVSEGKIDK